MEQARQTLQRTTMPIAAIGTIGGFVGDVLQPLGEISQWVAGISLIVALVAGIGWFRLYQQRGQQAWETALPVAFFIAAPTFVIFTLWSIIFAAGPERGYLAENVDPIAEIQAQLLGLQEDVTAIRETTEEIQQTTGQTQEQVEAVATQQLEDSETLGEIEETTGETLTQVEAMATAQAQGFAEIQEAFANLQSNESIVESPATPQEWYSNARLYQLRGDTSNAIQAYEGYFQFGLEYVDPYLRYVDLLNATEGIARTRQAIQDQLSEQPDNLALEFVSITLLEDPQERIAALNALAQRQPTFGPVWAELVREYHRMIQANATRDLLANQESALNTLLEREAQQNLSRYYIDKELASESVAIAQSQVDEWQALRTQTASPEVIITTVPEGMLFVISLMESGIQEWRVSVDDPQPTQSTGNTTGGLTGTMANPTIGPLLVMPGDHIFYYQYVDSNGVESPIFEEPFTVYPIALQFTQNPPDFSTGEISGIIVITQPWLEIGTIVNYVYSLDEPTLDQVTVGAPLTSLPLENLTVGEHVFYIQATEPAELATELVEFPFVVEEP